jgi:hypothetical protein
MTALNIPSNATEYMADLETELTPEEIEYCRKLDEQAQLKKQIAAARAQIQQLKQMAEAKDSFERFWAGSASQSISNDFASGRYVKRDCS